MRDLRNQASKNFTESQDQFLSWFPELSERLFKNFKVVKITFVVENLVSGRGTHEFVYKKDKPKECEPCFKLTPVRTSKGLKTLELQFPGLYKIPMFLEKVTRQELKNLGRKFRIYYLGPRPDRYSRMTPRKMATSFKVVFYDQHP